MKFTTYEKNNDFSMPMSYYEGNNINNELALGERFCFILIESGAGILQINNRNIPYISPAIFCINETENIIIDENSNAKIRAIYFHPSIINTNLNYINIRDVPNDFPVSSIQDCYLIKFFIERNNGFCGKINIGPLSNRRFENLCESFKIESTNQNRAHWPCRSRSYVMEILFLLENVYDESDISNDNILGQVDDELYSILIYIINNYDKKITIPSLTKEFNINRTTLSEKFNNAFGESIISYVNKLRINIASIILRDTKIPVTEVMERVGFSDNTHFLRTFKKYMGISPKEYRDENCWM